jgi:hypothetical protein
LKLESARAEHSSVVREHVEYKAKAKKVLLEKEKLISSLNETDSASGQRVDPAFSKAQLDQTM